MSSGCGDVLSLEDLKTAKKNQVFEAEVITGRAGGVAGGASIDFATNPNTGQVQKTMPAILRDIGFSPAPFDFDSGGTLTTSMRDYAVLWPLPGGDGDWYYWEGALPKVIPAGSTPASTGGVANGAWRPVGDITLRGQLASSAGASLVGVSPSGTVQNFYDNQSKRNTSWTTPFLYGAVGDGVADDTAAIKAAAAACAASVSSGNVLGLDLSGGPWRVSETIDLTLVRFIKSDFGGRFLVNPSAFTSTYTNKYVIIFGNPDSAYNLDRATINVVSGLLAVVADNRTSALNGIFIKGSLLTFGAIRVIGFNGEGVKISATWDSTWQSISCESCGNVSAYQFSIVAGGDTSNTLFIGRVQSEQAYHKCLSITAIRSNINTIHAERTSVLSTSDGTTAGASGLTYLNFNINVGNTTIKQIIHDCLTSGTAPDGSTLAAFISAVRINVDFGSVSDCAFSDSYVESNSGRQSAIDQIVAKRWYFDAANFTGNVLTNCRVSERLYPAANTTFIGGYFAEITPAFNASDLNFIGSEVVSYVSTNAIQGNISFSDCRFTGAGAIGDTKVPTGGALDSTVNETKRPVEFVRCSFNMPVSGAFRARAVFRDCNISSVNLASRAVFEFYNCAVTTFNYSGDRSFITRGCKVTTMSAVWGTPGITLFPVGTITERTDVDTGSLGSIFRCVSPTAATWVKLA